MSSLLVQIIDFLKIIDFTFPLDSFSHSRTPYTQEPSKSKPNTHHSSSSSSSSSSSLPLSPAMSNHDDPFFDFPNPPSSHSDWNKRILYMAIISLSLVLFLVFALHIYARYVLRRQTRRRVAIHRLSFTVAQSMESQNNTNGLDPNVISNLPTFIFKRKKTRKHIHGEEEEEEHQQHNDDDNDASIVECAVCLSTLEDEERVKLLPNCKHNFHVGCIDTWLVSHSTCPICRTKVEPILIKIEPQPREGPIGIVVVDGERIMTPASAPPLLIDQQIEGTSQQGNDHSNGASDKITISSVSSSRMSSFRRILSRERSSRRIQPFISHDDDDHHHDLERQ